jgi:general secretion pathway protein H
MLQRHRRSEERGFTLVEILVVCAIVAILLGLAIVGLGASDSRRLAGAAEDLSRRLEAARDEAVIRGQRLAFSSDGQAYQFWFSDGERNEWIALPSSDVIGARQLPQGIALAAMRINGLARPLGERIVFSISGISEPFALTLSCANSRVDIRADALGRIETSDAQ